MFLPLELYYVFQAKLVAGYKMMERWVQYTQNFIIVSTYSVLHSSLIIKYLNVSSLGGKEGLKSFLSTVLACFLSVSVYLQLCVNAFKAPKLDHNYSERAANTAIIAS